MHLEPIDKAVILARGRGTRMRQADGAAPLDERQAAAAERGHKAMIPIGGRPFLDYVLTALADSGYRRVCLVVGPEQEAMRDYYTHAVQPQRLRIEFALQPKAKGTADAVAAAESFVGREPFLMLNSDNYYPPQAFELMRVQSGSAVPLFERDALVAGSNIPAERVAKYAVGDIDERGLLRRIIEKPDAQALAAMPPPLWVSMNVWRFTPVIFDACRAIQPSVRGEYELVSAVQYAIDQLGEAFHVVRMRAAVLDLTSRGDIVPVAARLAGRKVQL